MAAKTWGQIGPAVGDEESGIDEHIYRVARAIDERRKRLRMAQCREGWHLEEEPSLEPDEPTLEQKFLARTRADVQAERDQAEAAGLPVEDLEQVPDDIDEQLRGLGVRGKVSSAKPRRVRFTKRRQDTPDLPRPRWTPAPWGRSTDPLRGNVPAVVDGADADVAVVRSAASRWHPGGPGEL